MNKYFWTFLIFVIATFLIEKFRNEFQLKRKWSNYKKSLIQLKNSYSKKNLESIEKSLNLISSTGIRFLLSLLFLVIPYLILCLFLSNNGIQLNKVFLISSLIYIPFFVPREK
tara:strand:- start:944 stop:1282 length:339 start_codon:yes stop_codon:yes gene_type:complete